MENYNTIARLLLICPLNILFKLRLNLSNTISRKISYNPFLGHTKFNIKRIIDEAIIKNGNIDDLKCYITRSFPCTDLDQITTTATGCVLINSISSSTPFESEKDVTIFCNKEPLHKLTFINVGLSTEFKMYSYINTNVSTTDTFTINFGLGVQDHVQGKTYKTYICCKEYTDDCLLFIGAKIHKCRINTCFRETFALIYNSNSNCFNYIMLDPSIPDVYSNNLTVNVFIRNNKHCAVISYLARNAVGKLYVYNINDGAMMYQTEIILDCDSYDPIYPKFPISISLIDNYLVYVKNNKYSSVITWINPDCWVIEDTITLVQKEANTLFDIKLIGIHKYLSLVIFINRKIGFDQDIAYRLMDVHHF